MHLGMLYSHLPHMSSSSPSPNLYHEPHLSFTLQLIQIKPSVLGISPLCPFPNSTNSLPCSWLNISLTHHYALKKPSPLFKYSLRFPCSSSHFLHWSLFLLPPSSQIPLNYRWKLAVSCIIGKPQKGFFRQLIKDQISWVSKTCHGYYIQRVRVSVI